MPTDNEIREHQAKHGVRVWGIGRVGSEPCRLGEIAVVPFYDHADALKAAERGERDRVITILTALRKHVDDEGSSACLYCRGLADAIDCISQPRLVAKEVGP